MLTRFPSMWPYFHFSGRKVLKKLTQRDDGITFSVCYNWESICRTPRSSQGFPRIFSLLCQLFSLKTNTWTKEKRGEKKKHTKILPPPDLILKLWKVRKIQAFHGAVLCVMDRQMQWIEQLKTPLSSTLCCNSELSGRLKPPFQNAAFYGAYYQSQN